MCSSGGVTTHPSFLYPITEMEQSVAKDKPNKAVKQDAFKPAPWISMRIGIIVISISSIVMAVLTGIQTVPALGWVEGLLWSLLFGVLIWAIFWGLIFINRWLRR